MHTLVRAAVVAALFTAASSFDRGLVAPPPIVVPPRKSLDAIGLAAPCAKGSLPEGDVCLPLSETRAVPSLAGELAPHQAGIEASASIPKLPDRPGDYDAYVLPIGEPGKAPAILDARLRKPSEREGVELATTRGDRLRAVAVEHQDGDSAIVIFAGDFFGITIVTLHATKDGDHEGQVALIMGELELVEPGLNTLSHVTEGEPLGYAMTGRLHLEAREIRPGVDIATLDPKRLLDPEVATPTDPRNVLRVR